MRVDPDILQDGGTFGDVVAAESVVGVKSVREVDGGYGAPAQNLLKSVVVYSSVVGCLASKKQAFRYGSLFRSSTLGGLPGSDTPSTSACARLRTSG